MLAFEPMSTAGSAKVEEPMAIAPPPLLPVPPSRAAPPERRVARNVRLGPESTLPSTLTTPAAAMRIAPPVAFDAPESMVVPEASETLPLTLAVMAPPVDPLELLDAVEMMALPLSARLPPTVSAIAPPLPEPERFSAYSAPPVLTDILPLTAKAMAQALTVLSSLQLTTPLMMRFPSLKVNTPLALPSWSLDEPSSAAKVFVPVNVTS